MPMIDVYAPAGTFRDRVKLARDVATAVMTIERVPNIPLFRQNTAAFVHELPPDSLSNVDGDSACIRVQVSGGDVASAPVATPQAPVLLQGHEPCACRPRASRSCGFVTFTARGSA